MSSTICTICKIVILMFVYAPLSEGIDIAKPVLYPPAACTFDGIIELIHGVTIPVCLKECERRSLCQSINYNRFIAVCVLRREVDIPLSATEPMRCVNVTIEDVHETLTDSCSNRPCDNSSLCIPSEVGSTYSCKLVYCISQPYIQNAELRSHAPTHIGGTNAYVCRDGFTEFGNAKVECETDGNWTETDFVCYPNCPTIPLKVGGSIMSRSTYRLTINTTVIYSCSTGYYNLSTPKITCNETGDWSYFECTPHCRQSNITEVISGNPTAGDYYTISMTAKYSCNDGYYLSPGSPIVHCDRHGHWSPPEIVCYKHCLMPSLDNSVMNNIPTGVFKEDLIITFACSSSYYTSGIGSEPFATCMNTGSWVYTHECYKHCGPPPEFTWDVLSFTFRATWIVKNHQSPYTFNSIAEYKCIGNDDLVYTENANIVCRKDGVWDGKIRCCIPIRWLPDYCWS